MRNLPPCLRLAADVLAISGARLVSAILGSPELYDEW